MTETMESLRCPICLEHLKEPVTTACGHSYCMDCIEGCWDQDEAKGVYRCPQCRQTFIPRPVLMKNIMLADLVENLKTGLQVSPSALHYAGPGDVACDVCTGRRFKAVKTCLGCLASYCDTHLQPHYQSEELKKHKLVDTSTQIQKQLGVKHEKSHYQQRIQERERKLIELKQTMTFIKHIVQTAVEDSEKIFAEMICSMARRRSEVKEMIRAQEKAELSRVEEHLGQLEQEIAELRRDDELEQLSHTEDHMSLLQTAQSLGDLVDPKAPCRSLVSFSLGFDDLKREVTELIKKMDHICQEELEKMSCSAKKQHSGKWWGFGLVMTLNMLTGDQGFGFRLVGGRETSEKILITDIVRHSAAHRDGRLKRGDELVAVDNVPVNQKTHEDVVALIGKAGQNGQVTLMVRRVQMDIKRVSCRPHRGVPANCPMQN
ncbi:E3 ubiquitin/ISG15 ligase TRIM25-like [Esox lucius]|uniref:Uncharacterized protein n=1 Tax=Esox lucius TaxID=8010 RepID=A0AAY5KI35_ESOLU|nr:E3 ubiquitin/ISG15 ligase TRIM25-like [Esox lucius]